MAAGNRILTSERLSKTSANSEESSVHLRPGELVAVVYPVRADDSVCRAPSAIDRDGLESAAGAAILAGR
jgi:hypothetical protein